MAQVGIVGCGLLGSALAERYTASAFEVIGYDVDPAALSRFPTHRANSLLELRTCEFLSICLPNSTISAQVFAQLDLPAGITVIDSTTGDPDDMAGFASLFAARGVRYLDATIGGSSRQVLRHEAIAIVGGEFQTFEDCQPIFQAIVSDAFYIGAAGNGARMKLVMNLVLGLNRAVLAEGLAFARRSGLDPAQALEILKASPAYSRAMDVKGQKMLDHEFTPEARLSQHLKDVRLILAQAARHGKPLPLSQLHQSLLEQAEAMGFGDADNAAIIKAYGQ